MPVIISRSSSKLSFSGTIPASGSLDVVISPLSSFTKGNFEIALVSVLESKYRGLEATAINTAPDITDSIYGKVGDILQVSLNFIKIGPDVVLRLTNSEAFEVSLLMEYTIF